jgi:hypothetical protein
MSLTWIQISSPAIALGLGALALIYAIAGRRRFERTFESSIARGAGTSLPDVLQIRTLMAQAVGSSKTGPFWRLHALLALQLVAMLSIFPLAYWWAFLPPGERSTQLEIGIVCMAVLYLGFALVFLFLVRRQRKLDEAANRVTRELLDQIRSDH